MQGQIFKIHSDFYYVETQSGVVECKISGVLKKRKDNIVVGDFVELEQINKNSKQAFIAKVLPRETYIPRPKVANVNQIIIVSALKEPDLDFEQLNRYLAFCEYYKLKPILCLVFSYSFPGLPNPTINFINSSYDIQHKQHS